MLFLNTNGRLSGVQGKNWKEFPSRRDTPFRLMPCTVLFKCQWKSVDYSAVLYWTVLYYHAVCTLRWIHDRDKISVNRILSNSCLIFCIFFSHLAIISRNITGLVYSMKKKKNITNSQWWEHLQGQNVLWRRVYFIFHRINSYHGGFWGFSFYFCPWTTIKSSSMVAIYPLEYEVISSPSNILFL